MLDHPHRVRTTHTHSMPGSMHWRLGGGINKNHFNGLADNKPGLLLQEADQFFKKINVISSSILHKERIQQSIGHSVPYIHPYELYSAHETPRSYHNSVMPWHVAPWHLISVHIPKHRVSSSHFLLNLDSNISRI